MFLAKQAGLPSLKKSDHTGTLPPMRQRVFPGRDPGKCFSRPWTRSAFRDRPRGHPLKSEINIEDRAATSRKTHSPSFCEHVPEYAGKVLSLRRSIFLG